MRIVSLIFDVFFPPRETELIVRETDTLPSLPDTRYNTTTLSHFSEPSVQAAITENKFYKNSHASKLLAKLMQNWIDTQTKPVICIPVPLGTKRLKERGHNQVTSVLRHCTGIKIETKTIERARETKPQSSLNKRERELNVRGAFTLAADVHLDTFSNRTIVIVDDVTTTGATMAAARAALAPHLPPSTTLICLTFAH